MHTYIIKSDKVFQNPMYFQKNGGVLRSYYSSLWQIDNEKEAGRIKQRKDSNMKLICHCWGEDILYIESVCVHFSYFDP